MQRRLTIQTVRLTGPDPATDYCRPAMVLFVVLVIISLLAILGASFSFRMNADLASVDAIRDIQQARLAAESGIDVALFILRDERTDMDAWYDNPEQFRRVPIWLEDKELGGSFNLSDKEEVKGEPIWRYSIVAYEREDEDEEEPKLRFGLTDEASKININIAPRLQLIKLFEQIAPEGVQPSALADTLIDWRDKDDNMNSDEGAESIHYMTMRPKYRAKNKWFETAEELLMVKGFNGRILYGEDYNRNGYLDENEDDSEEKGEEGHSMFPPDNGDGILNIGLLPLITVHSWDWNRANDNKMRLNINKIDFSKLEILPTSLTEPLMEELDEEVIQFIADAQKRGYKFRSVGELLGLEVYEDGSSNYDELWDQYNKQLAEEEKASREETESDQEEGEEEEETKEGEADGSEDEDQESEADQDESQEDKEDQDKEESDLDADQDSESDGTEEQEKKDEDQDEEDKKSNRSKKSSRRNKDTQDNQKDDSKNKDDGKDKDDGKNRDGDENKAPKQKGTPIISPVDETSMAVLVDRLTVSELPIIPGLINVNTASEAVLKTIPGLSEEEASAIVSQRKRLTGPEKMTPAWLVSSGALSDPSRFALICNQLTARSIQFTIDAIGFADHCGVAKRIQAVVEMQGHVAQIKYYRDNTSLRIGYPLTEEDERKRGFAIGN